MAYPVEHIPTNELHAEYTRLYTVNKDLLDNIYYASFVQQGILPHERHLKRLFAEYFVIYKPQNIVSGDLYWAGQKDEWKYFAVGDCTGHGISGALLSVLGLSFLNYLVLGKELVCPSKILAELDKKWIETFQQGAELGYNNDWLEIGLAAFNERTREIRFSGAFNKLICFIDTQALVLKGDRYPIGGWQIETHRKYNVHSMILPESTMVYLFSDGYKDQLGDLAQKRLTKERFYGLMAELSACSMEQQMRVLEEELERWKGAEKQTDDICIFGTRL